MPRYHFNIYDGRSTIDTDGTELPDYKVARQEAVRLAGIVMNEEANQVLDGKEWRLELADPSGLILFRLDVDFHESAAVVGAPIAG